MKKLKHIAYNAINYLIGERYHQNIQRFGLVLLGVLAFAGPADAQSIVDSGRTLFTYLYGGLGVAAGLAGVVMIINTFTGNWLGIHDNKKAFFGWVVITFVGFGIVGIIQAIKGSAGTGSASNL